MKASEDILFEMQGRARLESGWRSSLRKGKLAPFVWAAGTGLLYFLAALLALPLTTPEGVAEFWPAAGVAVGAFIAAGRSARLPIATAVATASFAANWLDGYTLPACFAFALGNTAEAALVAALAGRWFDSPFQLDRLKSVLGLFAVAVIGTALWEGATALILRLSSSTETPFAYLWGRLLWTNVTGIVMTAPLLLALVAAVRTLPPRHELIEGSAVLVLHAIATAHAFGLIFPGYGHWMLMVPLTTQLPLLLWLALRCGPLFAAAGTMVLGFATIESILAGRDRYAGAAFDLTERVIAAQYAVLAMSFVTLAIAALIAERRSAELNARRSEARLKQSLDAGNFGTWELDPESGWFQASVMARRCFGLPASLPAQFSDVLSALHPADRLLCEANFRRVGGEGGDLDTECRVLRPDGSLRWLHIMGRAAWDGARRQRSIAGAVRDVTDVKSIDALRQSAEQLRLFIEQAPVAIAMFDPEMRYLAASRRWIAEYSLSHRGLIGRSLYELFPGVEETWKDVHRRALKGEVISAEKAPFKGANGRTLWLRREIRPWRTASGNIGGIVIFTEDVTARVETERELRESREDLNRAQAVARTGSWRLDVNRNELSWSSETYRMFGIAQGTPMTYESFLFAVHPEDRGLVDRHWQAALSGAPYDIEHRIVAGNETKWVRERAELEFDANGELIGGFGTVQDITDSKQAEEQLRHQQNLTQLIGTGPRTQFS